jgi:hypothetical protein
MEKQNSIFKLGISPTSISIAKINLPVFHLFQFAASSQKLSETRYKYVCITPLL